jgi:hypothetical protein
MLLRLSHKLEQKITKSQIFLEHGVRNVVALHHKSYISSLSVKTIVAFTEFSFVENNGFIDHIS